jgi:hypothetical protein
VEVITLETSSHADLAAIDEIELGDDDVVVAAVAVTPPAEPEDANTLYNEEIYTRQRALERKYQVRNAVQL